MVSLKISPKLNSLLMSGRVRSVYHPGVSHSSGDLKSQPDNKMIRYKKRVETTLFLYLLLEIKFNA
jgi:hypothetical protein